MHQILIILLSMLFGACVNYLLERLKKKQQSKEERQEYTEGLFREMLENFSDLDMFDNRTILKPLHTEVCKNWLKKYTISLGDIWRSVEEYNKKIEELEHQKDNKESINNKIFEIRTAIYKVYAHIKEKKLHFRIGVINDRRALSKWGVMPPGYYLERLKKCNIEVHYISIKQLFSQQLWKFDCVINPYGEFFYTLNTRDIQGDTPCKSKVVKILKNFIEKGGIWVHTGGFPFHDVYNIKTGNSLPIELTTCLDLEIKRGKQGKVIISDKGLSVIGHETFSFERAYRTLSNATEVLAEIDSNGERMGAILGYKKIGKGIFVHYGGMHKLTDSLNERKKVAEKLILIVKYLAFKYEYYKHWKEDSDEIF